MTDRLTAAQWSRFWTKGTLTTFVGRFADNYDGPVRDFWHALLETLPQGCRIVDLATGNGGLALLAQQYGDRHAKAFDVTGIDYADIAPVRLFAKTPYARYLRKVRWVPRTRIEQTGLADASQGCAVSQFGFEYADARAAIAEVDRILEPQRAVFAAMMHHVDSAIVQQANDGVEQIITCTKSNLHQPITDLLKRLDRLKTRGKDPQSDEAARGLREQINATTAELEQEASKYRDPGQIAYFVQNSMAVFRPEIARTAPLQRKLAMLREVTAESTAYRQRMRDLVSAALSDDDFHRLEERLVGLRFRIESSGAFDFEGVHFCQAIVARR